jgi:hypothetical protein
MVMEKCQEMGVEFISLYPYLIDLNTLQVKKEYIHPNPKNHHLNPKTMAVLLRRKLLELGYN